MTTDITAEQLRRTPLPIPDSNGDKNQRGRVLVVAGSTAVPGGALLAGTAALRAGAGKIQIATCARIAVQLGLALPEALVVGLPETPDGDIAAEAAGLLSERVKHSDAVLIGPGMCNPATTAEIVVGLLRCEPRPAFRTRRGSFGGLATCARNFGKARGPHRDHPTRRRNGRASRHITGKHQRGSSSLCARSGRPPAMYRCPERAGDFRRQTRRAVLDLQRGLGWISHLRLWRYTCGSNRRPSRAWRPARECGAMGRLSARGSWKQSRSQARPDRIPRPRTAQ
jgi:hypothetical protein